MLIESSITLLDNIYSTGVTHDDRHMMIGIFLWNMPLTKLTNIVLGQKML
jgi:hypothetical protein